MENTAEAQARLDRANRSAGKSGTCYSKSPQELGLVHRVEPSRIQAHFSQGRKAAKRAARAAKLR